MTCPRGCDAVLAIADRGGIEIDYCPLCRGVWLDRGELDKLIERQSQVISQAVPSQLPGYQEAWGPAQVAQPGPSKDPKYRDDDDDDDDRDSKRKKKNRGLDILGEIFDF